MALKKEMVQNNGVTTNYHRVRSIIQNVNDNTIITLASYPTSDARDIEKKYEVIAKKFTNRGDIAITPEEREWYFDYHDIYSFENQIFLPYDESMNIDKAYKYLKENLDFEDAKDV